MIAAASARPTADALVRPGVAIGKVRLGMTLGQVERALGRPTHAQGAVEIVVKAPVREFGVGTIGACPADWRTW